MSTRAAWIKRDGAKVAFVASLVFLFFFQSTRAYHVSAASWQTDDGCYLQHLGGYIGIQSDEICQKPSNYYARGGAILWTIPGFIGKWIAHARGEEVTKWILPFVALSSYFFWALALYFTVRILRHFLRTRPDILGKTSIPVPLLALFILFATYSLHYGTARVFIPHAAELMLAMGCVLSLLHDQFPLAILFALCVSVTRYNDFPVVLLLLGRAMDRKEKVLALSRGLKTVVAVSILGLIACGIWVAFFKGYELLTLTDLFRDFKVSYLGEFFYFAIWGIIWSGWWWLIALLIGLARFPKMTWLGRAAAVWLLLEGLLCVLWGGNGGDFGWRYLIGSYAAALIVWLEALQTVPPLRPVFRFVTVMNGIWVMLMTMLYQTTEATNPHWINGNTACFIPPRLTLRLFEDLGNFAAFKVALMRQVVPWTLYLSRPGIVLPKGAPFPTLTGSEVTVTAVAASACAAFIAVYLIRATPYVVEKWTKWKTRGPSK